MEKFIPYEKLSKKKKRELDARKRGSWGGLNPVTRKPKNPKAYDRRKAQSWKKEPSSAPFVLSFFVAQVSSLPGPLRSAPGPVRRR